MRAVVVVVDVEDTWHRLEDLGILSAEELRC